jgi:hypothetical protein
VADLSAAKATVATRFNAVSVTNPFMLLNVKQPTKG